MGLNRHDVTLCDFIAQMILICSKKMLKFSSIPRYHYLTKLTMSWVLPVKGLGT